MKLLKNIFENFSIYTISKIERSWIFPIPMSILIQIFQEKNWDRTSSFNNAIFKNDDNKVNSSPLNQRQLLIRDIEAKIIN